MGENYPLKCNSKAFHKLSNSNERDKLSVVQQGFMEYDLHIPIPVIADSLQQSEQAKL